MILAETELTFSQQLLWHYRLDLEAVLIMQTLFCFWQAAPTQRQGLFCFLYCHCSEERGVAQSSWEGTQPRQPTDPRYNPSNMALCWVYKARERKRKEWWCSSTQVIATHNRTLLSWCSRQLFVVECRAELVCYNLILLHSICRDINLSSNARVWIKERKHIVKQLTAKRFGQFQCPRHLSECSTNRIKNAVEKIAAKTLNYSPSRK